VEVTVTAMLTPDASGPIFTDRPRRFRRDFRLDKAAKARHRHTAPISAALSPRRLAMSR
jgi:hypothetical protein